MCTDRASVAEPAPGSVEDSAKSAAASGGILFLGMAVLALVVQLPLDRESLAPSAGLAAHASAVTVTAWLLMATGTAHENRHDLTSLLITAGTAALATAALILATGPFDLRILALPSATFLLVGCFGAILRGISALTENRLVGATALLTVTTLFTTAPLWLGPAVEHFANQQSVVNTVLALSPLTYLAALADFDFLRTDWFYEHSVLGSLRYQYPSGWLMSALYACPILIALGLGLGAKPVFIGTAAQSLPHATHS